MKHFFEPPAQRLLYSLLSIIAAIALLSSAGILPVAAQDSPDGIQPKPSGALEQCINAKQATSAYNAQTGKINFIGAKPGDPVRQIRALSASASPEQAARGYLSDCGSLFGLSDQSAELVVKRQNQLSDGRSVVKFQQVYQNIPVFAGELVVQLDGSKNIIMVGGDVLPELKVNTQASVDAGSAQQKALQTVAGKYKYNSAALKVSEPQLWIYNPMLTQRQAGPSALVWRMEVTPVELAPIRELVLIDAQQGSVALNFNQVDTALNRLTYNARNGTNRPGTLVCNESNPTCLGGDRHAVNAHVYGGDTYNFYSDYFGRDSLDNKGMTLISTVHFATGYCNAFWDGSQMTYGDGCFIVADDVVGHEMTHGVTEHESNLIYAYEPGAINESLSDIFGEFVDLTNGKGNDSPSVRWQIGEDTTGGTWGNGALRNMKDPTLFNQPDRMGSPLYYVGSYDNGGVHTNSGVGNKAAYLITDGDTFNGYTVTGIGITKAAKIYYEAQTNILTTNSNYYALYLALNQACNNLVGTSGITADDCTQVNNATLATEMNIGIPTPTVPKLLAPAGIIMDRTPTYQWTKIIGATWYRYQVNKGATTLYTQTVPSSVCGASVCANTPATKLGYATFQWRAQALVGGVWRPFSLYKAFIIENPNTKPKAGRWAGIYNGFYVTGDQANVDNFSVHIYVFGCGISGWVIHLPFAPIVNRRFSFNGHFYARGVFDTTRSAHGTNGLDHFYIQNCGRVSGGPWPWIISWRSAGQAAFMAEKVGEPLIFEPTLPGLQSPEDSHIINVIDN